MLFSGEIKKLFLIETHAAEHLHDYTDNPHHKGQNQRGPRYNGGPGVRFESPGADVMDKEKNIFEISGKSLPEDVVDFYQPLLDWLNKYRSTPNPKTEFTFKLMYFNTASSAGLIFACCASVAGRIGMRGKPASTPCNDCA